MTVQSIVIIEEGEHLEVTLDEFKRLDAAGLAYMCPECGDDTAHIGVDRTMNEACEFLGIPS